MILTYELWMAQRCSGISVDHNWKVLQLQQTSRSHTNEGDAAILTGGPLSKAGDGKERTEEGQ